MKREDIIDSMEYIEEDYIREADRSRNTGDPDRDTGKISAFPGKTPGRSSRARKWGTLAASLAVLAIAAFVITGVLRIRSGIMNTMQTAEVTEAEDAHTSAENHKTAEAPAAEPEYAAEETQNAEPEYESAEAPAAEPEYESAEAPAAEPDYAAEEMPYAEPDYAPEEEFSAAGNAAAYDAEEASVLIRVTSDAGDVVFVLNETPAARSLAAMLPLHADTEPYGDNEIIFHPDEPLDTENGLEGGGTAGCLGYFAPWNNVVMYYGDFDEYPGLYILGEAVSGAENIENIRGAVTVEPAEEVP